MYGRHILNIRRQFKGKRITTKTYKLIKRSWCDYIYRRENRLTIRLLIHIDKANNFCIIKWSIQQENNHTHVTNNTCSKFIKQKMTEVKRQTDNNHN